MIEWIQKLDRTLQNKTDPDRTRQNLIEPDRTRQVPEEPERARQNWQSGSKPSRNRWNLTEPERIEPDRKTEYDRTIKNLVQNLLKLDWTLQNP